jgi:tRNA-Thr(GGU) m(6)t(6)A37 methyltransferase TsaA
MRYELRPIGHVSKSTGQPKLVIDTEYKDAMVNLELFSHIIVLWWIDGVDNPEDRKRLLANPPRNKNPEQSGVFACRSPFRPNPIGHTISAVLEVNHETSEILLDHMDANDGSPILDVKPYLPSSDRVTDARVAPWFEDLIVRY